jgi:DNA invertase Pin-like site-specific DNA recombinase
MIAPARSEMLAEAQRAYADGRDRVWIDRVGAGIAYRRALREIDDGVRVAREKRDAAVVAAVEAGGSYREVARALGLSHGRVQQIVNAHRDSPVR